MFRRCLVVALAAAALPLPAQVPGSAYDRLHWRLLGPFRGGWATAVAGVPGDPATFYFGGADGGVWKTTDAGVTWRPLFDRQGSASIGALTLAPSDPRVIWAGTGQVHQRYDIADGDGVYRSTDAGATWTNVGLRQSRHIGQIWVDPQDPAIALVAALGPVFASGGERGLFRTADAGKSWTNVLRRDDDTGAVDIAGDARALYAALWQVRRHPWLDYFQPAAGPGSGLQRSIDGGRTWAACGANGLPTGPLGRIDLAVAPGGRVLATIDVRPGGGLYASDDGCATWTQVNPDASLANSYMNGVVPDPRDASVLWVMGRSLRRSTDGGKTFSIFKGAPGGDDYHTLWIDPTDPRRMITGADQGAVVTLNGGASWSSWYNQPTGQFYRLAADDRFPYRVYSGQQDSGTVSIASRSDLGQLTFRDWHPVGGDERDADVPMPGNPDIVFGAGLGGRISRWDARTGQAQNVSPWPLGSYGGRPRPGQERFSWINPLAISPRPPHALYLGAQSVARSTDAGATWAVGPDLTGAVPGARGCDGDVPVARATACGWGTVFAIAPSPLDAALVWAGTDNGRVHLSRDAGATWKDVTPPGLADWTRVAMIDASATDPATAYLAADRHRLGDLRPQAFRTHDGGATWTEIGHGLPDGAWVGVVRQDPQRAGLLYAGTSRGVHVSFDDGERWQSLQLDLPTTGINDLLVKGDDLIAATQGRAIWALDAVAVLRQLPAAGPFLARPGAAYRVRRSVAKDTPLPPEEPRGENPPVGAVIDYLLSREGPVRIEIVDGAGRTVRRFGSADAAPELPEPYFAPLWGGAPALPTGRAGHNRFVWDLRREPLRALDREYSIAAVPGRPTDALPAGALVLPGTYEVRLLAEGQTLRQPLTVLADPRVSASAADLAALLAFQDEVEVELSRSARLAEARQAAAGRLKAALPGAPDRAAIEKVLAELTRRLPAEQDPAAINAGLAQLATDVGHADAPPTAAQRAILGVLREQIGACEENWRRLSQGPLAEVEKRAPQR